MSKPLKSNAKVDLFGADAPKVAAPPKPAPRASSAEDGYTAADIEVLEGLEPVRRRPGMYIGGTDEKALHQRKDLLCRSISMLWPWFFKF